MKWTPITERLPKLDTPILITVQYEGNDSVEVTDTELFNDPCSTINPCFNMGSARNYKVFAWRYYMPLPATNKSHIHYHEMVWNEVERSWDRPRTFF